MCGICGVLSATDGPSANRLSVRRMSDALAHRGPDDEGVFFDDGNGLGLGFRRLSIIDLSSAGHQPMPNEDRSVWLIFNGEVYNFASLRQQLEAAGHRFSSQTDSETILHGYEEWGLDVVPRLQGMFGFALWDATRKRLVLARDRLGIKPLFYYRDPDRLLFASELKAVLSAPGVDCTPDRRALYDYLTYTYIPCPQTAYRRIRKLPAGHLLVLDPSGEQLTRYWDVSCVPRGDLSEEDAVGLVRTGLSSAVASHLVADVPVGVFLSGGMDSSAIALEMASATPEPFHTFTVGFDVAEHSELPFAKAIAERIGSRHYERILSWPDAQSQLADVVRVYDEPFADSSSVPTLAVSRLAREHVTVALSGEGGDEIFAGYESYRLSAQTAHLAGYFPGALASAAATVGRAWPLPRGERIGRLLDDLDQSPLERFARSMERTSAEERRRLISPSLARELGDYDDYWYLRQFWRDEVDPITRLQYLDLKTYLPDDLLVKADRASMAVSLEVRVPMLDHRLVETLFAIPGEIRFKNGITKHLERRAMAGRLPEVTLNRPKMGFTPPLSQWLRRPLPPWVSQRLDRGAAVDLGIVAPGAIDRLSLRPRWLWASKVWALLVLEEWASREQSTGGSNSVQQAHLQTAL